MRKFVLSALLLVSFPFTQRPTEVQAATSYEKVHVNWYTRYDYVEVNDLSRPIYRTSAPTPILRDKYENKIVGYEQLWDYEYVPRYESRAVSYVAGYENRPIYQARSETYVAYYDEYPIIATRQESYLVGYNHERVVIGYEPSYSTRQVCTFRWRGSCREWGTETYVSAQRPVYGTRSTPVYGTRTVSYVAGMGRRPVYATRTVQVLVGYERVPVYATRMETVQVGTSKVRVPGGRKPIYDLVKVCSACEIEGYSPPVKVLVGYQKKTVPQPVGETTVPCPGWGDCSGKGPIFVKGAWHEFSRHEDQCRVGGSINGARVANSLCDGGPVDPQDNWCPAGTILAGQVKPLDGNCNPDKPVERCPAGTSLAGQVKPLDGNCNPDKPVERCPAGTSLAGQEMPLDGNCNPDKPVERCPAGTILAGQEMPLDGNCNPDKPVERCPAGTILAGQVKPSDGNCNPASTTRPTIVVRPS